MKNKTVVIRVQKDTRQRLKVKAAKKVISMIKLIDDLSKSDLPKIN